MRKGYKGTTTKTIAQEAGVNELTIFRHFGTKEGILRALIDERYTLYLRMLDEIRRKLTYDIAADFPKIASLFHEKLAEIFRLVLLFVNEDTLEEETVQSFARIPLTSKEFLTSYFEEAKRRGGKSFDPEIAALMYMSMNFGFLVLKQRLFTNVSNTFESRYLDVSIEAFVKFLE